MLNINTEEIFLAKIDKFISDYVTDKMAEGMASKVRGWSLSKIVEELPTFSTFPQWRKSRLSHSRVDLSLKILVRHEVLRRCNLA